MKLYKRQATGIGLKLSCPSPFVFPFRNRVTATDG
jgi:hypothetical protein